MLYTLLITLLTSSSTHYLPNCNTDYFLNDTLGFSWRVSGDTLLTTSDTLVLKGLKIHVHKNSLAFVGLDHEDWLVGLLRSGKINFTQSFKKVPDELPPLVRAYKNGLTVVFPSRAKIYLLDTTGINQNQLSLYDKKFYDEISIDAFPLKDTDQIWVVASTAEGTLLKLIQKKSTVLEWSFDNLYFDSGSITDKTLLLSVFSVARGVPGNYKLLAFSEKGLLWEFSSSSVVKLSGSVGNSQLVRIGGLWQLIDVKSGITHKVFPEIPKKSKTWILGKDNVIIVAWAELPITNLTCYIIIAMPRERNQIKCVDDVPVLNPLQEVNGKIYLKTCSRFLELY